MSNLEKLRFVGLVFTIPIASFFLTINLIPAIKISSPTVESGNQTFDVIIALGYPANADGTASPMMTQRVKKAVELFQNHSARYIICTGGAAHNEHIETTVMAVLMQSMGIPATQIIEEMRAKNTYQNILNSVNIMQQRGWKSAIAVTSPNHLKRTSYLLSHYPIRYAVAASAYPEDMGFLQQLLLNQWENYLLTRIALKL